MANTLIITILAFLVGAVISIVLVLIKRKKIEEYIPFGPFITIGAFILMFIPYNIVLKFLMKVFTLGFFKNTK